MQAIQTSFIPCTNTKGGRIKAECWAGKVIISWNYGLNTEDNHKAACVTLMNKLGWYNGFNTGQLKNGSYAHVLMPKRTATY